MRERELLSATVRELASPVMPVLEGILVMPLIGVIDNARYVADGFAAWGDRAPPRQNRDHGRHRRAIGMCRGFSVSFMDASADIWHTKTSQRVVR